MCGKSPALVSDGYEAQGEGGSKWLGNSSPVTKSNYIKATALWISALSILSQAFILHSPLFFSFYQRFICLGFDKLPQSFIWEFCPQDIQQWNICCDIDDIACFHKTVAFNTHIWHWKISQTGKLWLFGEPFIAKMRNSKNLKWWLNITLTSKLKWIFIFGVFFIWLSKAIL